ncbi:LOW QUALITY PROTEIN: chemerin-like receptor 1 [Sphaerodactylus townsendi]|uniref:LOW QUALITY PROTEIN: chemerin-like receptor 1 n=1 Tax=Sphaerodactylus townsendi TaxID=933632 RepID=UPI0020261B46|nr:LOW QUALITY PROTEIN: chemerin-like receptor 1 [Sphaerodactylus townsendi]
MEDTTQLTTLANGTFCTNLDYYYAKEVLAFVPILQKILNILSMVTNGVTFVLGVTGNGLVIFITGFRMKKTVNTIHLLNLAIADFTFTLFLPLSIVYQAQGFHWPFGEAMCKFNSALAIVNVHASIYLLMVISIDRCIFCGYAPGILNHRSPPPGFFLALGFGSLAVVLFHPSIHFTKTLKNGDVISCCPKFSHNEDQAKAIHRDIVISRFIFAFMIPFPVIIICYGAIVLRLRRDHLASSSKPFKVITAVILAFFICWFPFHVFSFLEIQADKDHSLHLSLIIGNPLAYSLAFMNSCLNPILYVFMGHDFKESFKHSILSVFESVFAEDVNQITTQKMTRSSVEMDSPDL